MHLVRTISLSGVEGRIDHLAVDLEHERLLVAALGNNTVEVIDLRAGVRVRSIGGLREPQGIAYVPGTDRIVVANGETGMAEIFDGSGSDFEKKSRVPFGEDADNVRYDATAKLVWVGYGSGALGVIDPADGSQRGKVALAGHPESFLLEKAGVRIFVNVPTASHVAVVDREKRSVVAKWPLTGAGSNYPMALDEEHARLFIGCRQPPRLLVLDSASGHAVSSVEIAGDADDVFYDARRGHVYVVCGDGHIVVLRQVDPDHYDVAGRVATSAGARTGLFVPELDLLFVAVPHRGAQTAEIRVFSPEPKADR